MPPFHAYSFIPSVIWSPPLPLTHGVANLLLTNDVQEISFSFGSVVTLPEGFRAVANALIRGDVGITTDPNLVPVGKRAVYEKDTNMIRFCQDDILDFPEGRALAVHESVHVMHDIRGRNTSVRSEESAAYIAKAWYLFSGMDPRPATMPIELWDIAVQIRSRGTLGVGPAHASGAEIQACRALIAHKYVNGHYGNDGV